MVKIKHLFFRIAKIAFTIELFFMDITGFNAEADKFSNIVKNGDSVIHELIITSLNLASISNTRKRK